MAIAEKSNHANEIIMQCGGFFAVAGLCEQILLHEYVAGGARKNLTYVKKLSVLT
jgi:hypothetical protein